ncbi:GntR family transcriptional regulator [Nonomuraea pusilla]|uniref:winged helix-turn-helix domain-containing protein n=1 Tax=Nonomuraea pusilla TaxID=46177 RepID=UPI00331F67C2
MLDRDGPVPLYVQIAELIEQRISDGELRPGERVESESALEAEFDIARTTARSVVRELRRRRLVHTVPGEGTYVGPPGVPRIRQVRALYLDVARDIVSRIRRGELRPNRPIPSEQALMMRHGVAKVTVRKAVAYLREQGWVFAVPRGGVFVCPPHRWPAEGPYGGLGGERPRE